MSDQRLHDLAGVSDTRTIDCRDLTNSWSCGAECGFSTAPVRWTNH